jgi:hypothetical protein
MTNQGPIMAAIAFDTLKAARRLKEVGVPEAQAELMAEAFVYNVDSLVTNDYLDARFSKSEAGLQARFTAIDQRFASIDVQFAEVKGEFRLVYWMLVIIIASTVTPYLQKLFGLLAG